MKKLLTALAVALAYAPCIQAAFPTWMGVYGNVSHHTDGSNPGTYTVLLNEDYPGLRANVGIQVDGGAWREYPMGYAGKKDRNSKWEFTPSAEVPAGSTVRYYFHGWDDKGGHIYDNNGGKDYTFKAVPSPAMRFSAPESVADTNSTALLADLDGTLYRLVYEVIDPSGPGTCRISLSRRVNGSWQPPLVMSSTIQGWPSEFAASGSGLHFLSGTNYFRSQDLGATWQVLPKPSEYGCRLAADADYTYVVHANYSDLLISRMHKSASVWETPVRIAAFYGSLDDLLVTGSTIALATHIDNYGYTATWYTYEFAYWESRDRGLSWRRADPPGYDMQHPWYSYRPLAHLAADASGAIYLLGLGKVDDASDAICVWKRANGSWSAPSVLWKSGRPAGLASTPQGLVACNDSALYRMSTDGGAGWSNERQISTKFSLLQGNASGIKGGIVAEEGGAADRITIGYPYTGGVQRLHWSGNGHFWPPQGSIQPTNDVWVNVESWPTGAVVQAQVVYSTNNVTWQTVDLTFDKVTGNNDSWHANLGTFPAGTTIRYGTRLVDGVGTISWDNREGRNHKAVVNGGKPCHWGGNVYNSSMMYEKFVNKVWLNLETWPKDGAQTVRLIISTDDGTSWQAAAMNKWTVIGNNDAWHYLFAAPNSADFSKVVYFLEVVDGLGNAFWVNNGGANYRLKLQ